jgi:hypothetical protein
MGNEVIVVAGATHRAGLLDDYQRQLEQAGVLFHLEMVAPMPAGPNSMTMRRKAEFVRQMSEMFINYATIYITDAWDVLFFGTKQELNNKSSLFLFSAERNSYPEQVEARGDTLWRYLNAGCMCGDPRWLVQWGTEILKLSDLDLLDQAWMNRNMNNFPIDTSTSLFYTVSANDSDLKAKNGRPWNSACDTYPNFLHFSGGRNADQWRMI